ncbi:RloB family protein [Protofrankia sp. BMG5.30]|uniref:RloB family protein n=1 Tax=Protofrankia TaxID=2994361 RepID=UPI001F2B3633
MKKLPEVARRTSVRIEIDAGQGVPLTLVRRAVERKKDPEVDECWCVFDVEWPKNHPNLTEAVDLARAHDIGLAVSNPCFELWLILHHQDYNRSADTAAVERKSRLLDGRPGKSIDAELYIPRRKDAARRALALATRHEKNGTVFPRDNPSSSMPALLTALEA